MTKNKRQYRVTDHNQRVEIAPESLAVAPRVHTIVDDDGVVIPIIHGDSLHVSMDLLSQDDWDEVKAGFINMAIKYGGNGLYVPINPEYARSLAETLLKVADDLEKAITSGRSPADARWQDKSNETNEALDRIIEEVGDDG